MSHNSINSNMLLLIVGKIKINNHIIVEIAAQELYQNNLSANINKLILHYIQFKNIFLLNYMYFFYDKYNTQLLRMGVKI